MKVMYPPMFVNKPNRGSFYHLQAVESSNDRNQTKPRNTWTPFFVKSPDGESRICALWSVNTKDGFDSPPPIGTRVVITFNQLGAGEVAGYFVESGFLGVEIKPDKRPDWHIKQGSKPHYLVFGAEIRREV